MDGKHPRAGIPLEGKARHVQGRLHGAGRCLRTRDEGTFLLRRRTGPLVDADVHRAEEGAWREVAQQACELAGLVLEECLVKPRRPKGSRTEPESEGES